MKAVEKVEHKPVSDKLVKHLFQGKHLDVHKLDTTIYIKDSIMNLGVRFGYNRFSYKVPPGLYSIGEPSEDDLVIVTCNYKLTVDVLRKELKSQNLWLLILDTDGVNVWCAAGKGSFGSAELIYSIRESDLENKISHRKLILPQLAAPGIQAHLIKEITGFNVVYGPIKASDVVPFITSEFKASDDMRRIEFKLLDRIKVIPLELLAGIKYLTIMVLIFLIGSIVIPSIGFNEVMKISGIFTIGVLTGTVLYPIVMPLMPFKMFYKNGILLSFVILSVYLTLVGWMGLISIGSALISIALSGYITMNFTGSTTFTSLSGVKKEMEKAIPILGFILLTGVISVLIGIIMEVLS